MNETHVGVNGDAGGEVSPADEYIIIRKQVSYVVILSTSSSENRLVMW